MKLSILLSENNDGAFSVCAEFEFIQKHPEYSDLDSVVDQKIIIGAEKLTFDAFYNPDERGFAIEVHQNKRAIFQLSSNVSISGSFLTLGGTSVGFSASSQLHV